MSGDNDWITYLKESGFWDTYDGMCECASCARIRKGFEQWQSKSKSLPEPDRLTTLLAVIEQCEKALALVEFSFKDETGFMSARGQIFQNKITNALAAIKKVKESK